MSADVKRTRDPNNFINIILNKIELAKHFHQRVALSITSKTILNCCTLKFYIRKRHNELYLYTRILGNFGSIKQRHLFMKELAYLCSQDLESTKGHLTGLILHLTGETKDALIDYFKLISLLARPKDFYKKQTKIYTSYFNYPEKSNIPIHIRITNSNIEKLHSFNNNSLIYDTLNNIGPKHE